VTLVLANGFRNLSRDGDRLHPYPRPRSHGPSTMFLFLTTEPLWVSAPIIVGLGTVLSMLGLVLVRHYVDVRSLTANNEIAGHKFATIGVFYAVLLAFAIILVWQKFADAEADVVREAGAAENIYRLSQGVTDKAGAAVRGALANYLKAAINDDWPAMDRGAAGAGGAAKQALDAVYSTLVSTSGQGDSAVVSEMLRQVDLVTLSRRARLIASEGAVPNLLWLLLIGGAAITIGYTFFFGAESLRAQALMTALLAILIFSELLVVVGIDRPFSGTVKVGPNALVAVLADNRASIR
jgi:hypothetical protein